MEQGGARHYATSAARLRRPSLPADDDRAVPALLLEDGLLRGSCSCRGPRSPCRTRSSKKFFQSSAQQASLAGLGIANRSRSRSTTSTARAQPSRGLLAHLFLRRPSARPPCRGFPPRGHGAGVESRASLKPLSRLSPSLRGPPPGCARAPRHLRGVVLAHPYPGATRTAPSLRCPADVSRGTIAARLSGSLSRREAPVLRPSQPARGAPGRKATLRARCARPWQPGSSPLGLHPGRRRTGTPRRKSE